MTDKHSRPSYKNPKYRKQFEQDPDALGPILAFLLVLFLLLMLIPY